MALLPNSEHAVLDLRKIKDYCLDFTHPRGRHKARLFRDVLGVGRADAMWFRTILLDGIRSTDAIELAGDAFGHRWRVDVPITRHGKRAVVRTIWIVRSGEIAPRFVTCWVL